MTHGEFCLRDAAEWMAETAEERKSRRAASWQVMGLGVVSLGMSVWLRRVWQRRSRLFEE